MEFINCATAQVSPSVDASNCGVLLEQAARVGFADLPYGTTMGTAATLKLAATMTALMAASTSTRVIVPQSKLFDPSVAGTEAVTYGSNDNTTPRGRTITLGETVPIVTGNYANLTPAQYKQLGTIFGNGNTSVDVATVGVFFLLGEDKLLVKKVATDTYVPFPARSFFISSPTGFQLHTLTLFNWRFELQKGWYKDAELITLNYQHDIL